MYLLALLTLTSAPPPADTAKVVKFTADAGFVSTSGNTDITTVNVGEKLEFLPAAWKFAQTFGIIYGRTDGTTSSSLWRGGLRGERTLSSRVGFFVLSEFDRNRFAGIRSRVASSGGLSAVLIKTGRDELNAEVGAGYTWERATDSTEDRNYSAGRVAMHFGHHFGSHAMFTQALEYLPDFETGSNYRVNSQTAFTAPIAAGIAMKAGYEIRYAGLPRAGFKKTDRILTTGVQVAF